MWSIFITAVGFLFVFEGILPFWSPHVWRRLMQQIFIQTDHSLRVMGLTSMLLGLALICVAREFY